MRSFFYRNGHASLHVVNSIFMTAKQQILWRKFTNFK